MEIPLCFVQFLFCFIFLCVYISFETTEWIRIMFTFFPFHVLEQSSLCFPLRKRHRTTIPAYLTLRNRYALRYFSETAPAAATTSIRPQSSAPACFHS